VELMGVNCDEEDRVGVDEDRGLCRWESIN